MAAPIALFAYKRPDHLQRTVESLKSNARARESHLYVYSDGAKSDADIRQVSEVRAYLGTIDGFASVTVMARETNAGLANSIKDGVTQLCDQYGSVIVVEDDLVVASCFLDYMNVVLDKYSNDERIMQISGYQFPVNTDCGHALCFMPLTTSWGWAIWDRAWKNYTDDVLLYRKMAGNPELRYRFNINGNYDYFPMLEAQHEGKIDSWAIHWYATVFMKKGLVAYPKVSLVTNTGMDGSGTHAQTLVSSNAGHVDVERIRHDTFPVEICESTYAKVVSYFADQKRRTGRGKSTGRFSRLRNLFNYKKP